MRKLIPYLVLVLATAVLAACTTTLAPQGVGSGADSYKRSPCACGPQVFPRLPAA